MNAGQTSYGKYSGNDVNKTSESTQSSQSFANLQWRTNLSRLQRQDLISKIYNELIRATGEAPGPNVWMKASNYEMKLFHESDDQEQYLSKISRRLYLLSQRPTLVNPLLQQLQQMQQVPMNNVQMQSHGHSPGNLQHFQSFNSSMPSAGGLIPPPNRGQQIPDGGVAAYWAKHAELKSKYWDDCVFVYKSFRQYVDLGRVDDEQCKRLKSILRYIHQVVTFLGESREINPPKPIDELRKAEGYIQKIVVPYLNKLKSETSKKNENSEERSQALRVGNDRSSSPASQGMYIKPTDNAETALENGNSFEDYGLSFDASSPAPGGFSTASENPGNI